MAYATAAEVTTEFKSVDFAATNAAVSTADVTQFIVEADSEINSKIGLVYETPVAAGEGLQLLKMLSKMLVKDRIDGILSVKTGQPDSKQEAGQTVQEKVDKILGEIASGKRVLLGATKISSGDGVNSYASSTGKEFTMKRDETQW